MTLRKTGIDVLGDVRWGTHFCQFYQTREDLTDILVPYFSEGLRSNELCIWITSDPLTKQQAQDALRNKLPDLDLYLENGQLEILPYSYWYAREGGFDSRKVLNACKDKLNHALASGYEGLRLSGNKFRHEKDRWEEFRAYEEEIDGNIDGYQMIALCSYPLDSCSASEILDIVKHHQFALAKREGSWELIENSRHRAVFSAFKENEAKVLEEQKEILQSIIDNIPVMLAFYDSEGRIRLVNSEFERVLGWSMDEARNMDLLAACRPQPSDAKLPNRIREHKPLWRDYDITSRSGSIIHSSWATVRLSDGSLIGIGIDVSTRRKMEQDLLKLAAAIEQTGEGLVLFSPEGVIEYANPAYESLSGYRIRELIGKTACCFAHEINVDYKAIFHRIRTDGKTWTGRKTIKQSTGDVLEANMSVSPVLGTTGEIINFVAAIQDITQETMLQQQLSQTQKMETIGTLAGGIAHDLKNIFTPILINTEIALEDLEEGSPVSPLLQEVLEATRLGVDLVHQIVTFSRRVPLAKKPVAASSIVKEGLSFIRSALPATIEIRSRLNDFRSMILADPTRIKQVMINLGSNAAYAMRDQCGIMEVNLDNVVLDAGTASLVSSELPAGAYVRITVRDTGTGMDDKTAARVFEPFFTTKKGEGTGMGLAVAHGIVKDHLGAIAVRSKPGKGTTFTVYLPKLHEGNV